LRGKVLDDSGKSLPGATLFIRELKLGVVTDIEGNYTFSGLCSKSYIFEIQFLGFASLEKKIRLTKSDEINFQLSPENKLLQEVVVSDHHQIVNKTNNFSTLTSGDLEEVKGKSLGQTLQGITGVNSIQTGPAIFKPVIHGVHSQRILILNNGIRQEGQQWGAEHAPEIDPFIANNIVVIKDAGAIKYGTDALGGVIIVTPADLPTDQKQGGEFHLIGNTNGRAGTISGLVRGRAQKSKGLGLACSGNWKKVGRLARCRL
jgi:iron complex outermembrane recepter protein